jgi:S1-C subfamily serine protease
MKFASAAIKFLLLASPLCLAKVDYDELRSSVVRIQAVGGEFDWFHPFMPPQDGIGLGTGFIVQTEPYLLFATNQHVINDASQVSLQLLLFGEKKWDVQVVTTCPRFDLALLTLKDDAGFKAAMKEMSIVPKALKLSSSVAAMGQDVVALGFPLGQNSLKISKGNVAGNQVVNNNLCIQSTAPISPGNSGGPLMDADGEEVVGVNFAKATSGENVNYVIPAWRLKQIVQHHLSAQTDVPSNGTWKRLPLRVPSDEVTVEVPNLALYSLSKGCNKGVYMARIGERSFLNKATPAIKKGSFLVSVAGKKLDRFGMGRYPEFAADKVSFTDLFFMTPDLSDNVEFETCHQGKLVSHKVKIAWSEEFSKGLATVEEPNVNGFGQKYEMFGDLSVMQMTVNHVASLVRAGSTSVARWLEPTEIIHPRLIVNFVRQGSEVSEFLVPGAAVEKVNGKTVRTMEDFKANLVPPKGQNIWTLETDRGLVAALPFKETMKSQLMRGQEQHFYLTPGFIEKAQLLGFMPSQEEAVEKKIVVHHSKKAPKLARKHHRKAGLRGHSHEASLIQESKRPIENLEVRARGPLLVTKVNQRGYTDTTFAIDA